MSPTPKIACPSCGEYLSRVKDSRPSPPLDPIAGVIRRRECLNQECRDRYRTKEILYQPKKKKHHKM